MNSRKWCDTCRGDGGGGGSDALLRCKACPRRFHLECAGLRRKPETAERWKCPHCCSSSTTAGSSSPDCDEDVGDRRATNATKKRVSDVRRAHRELRASSSVFFALERPRLSPFVERDRLDALCSAPGAAKATSKTKQNARVDKLTIGPAPPFVVASLRDYQVDGVNWLLSRHALGIGGILADEMGLGKTIQTLAFLAKLKDAGRPGPHLVITPFAVLQNWANEIKKFTPGLSHVKIHGSINERDRILTTKAVTRGEYDIYLTTYDTLLAEEPFFTESFLFHTIVIDEGHRLKNSHSKLCKGLNRITAPFRVLLTRTPIQNNLNELWALLQYILPTALDKQAEDGSSAMSSAASAEDGSLDRIRIRQARALLEAVMIRRVKSDVTAELKPKINYTLKIPLTRLQRELYRSLLQDDGSSDRSVTGLLTANQLMMKVLQLGKVTNHPKTLALTFDRERAKAACKARAAAGSEFIRLDREPSGRPETPAAKAQEAEMRSGGERLRRVPSVELPPLQIRRQRSSFDGVPLHVHRRYRQ